MGYLVNLLESNKLNKKNWQIGRVVKVGVQQNIVERRECESSQRAMPQCLSTIGKTGKNKTRSRGCGFVVSLVAGARNHLKLLFRAAA